MIKSHQHIKNRLQCSDQVLVGILFFIIVWFFSSCNKIDKPYINWIPPNPLSGDTIRKILIEDYTGHRCSNCPRAAYTIHKFQETVFPRQVIAVAIHPKGGGSFTLPDAAHPLDFRTPIGDKFDADFGISKLGIPNGMINRRKNSSGFAIPDSKWKDTVAFILQNKPDALLKITNDYNGNTRKLSIEVKCNFLNSLAGNYNLIVLLTQDSIKSAQDYNGVGGDPVWHSPTETDYWHMHVLRACLSDGSGAVSGIGVSVGSFVQGSSVTKYFVLEPVPAIYGNIPVDIKQCNVIAFLYNLATKEVIQAEDERIIK